MIGSVSPRDPRCVSIAHVEVVQRTSGCLGQLPEVLESRFWQVVEYSSLIPVVSEGGEKKSPN